MKSGFDAVLNRRIVEIFPGECFVWNDPRTVASTLLGSCVAVCLYDARGVYGMNHFMLPGDLRDEGFLGNVDGRYGVHAMELLLGGLLGLGATRADLQAKVFGGGRTVGFESGIAQVNVDFAEAFLKMEGIPIRAVDTGGKLARRIYFFPEADVYVRKIPVND